MNKLWITFGIFMLLILIPSQALAQGVNPPVPPVLSGGNVVLDTLDWLTPSQETEINTINQKLDQEGIAQIAVVTLNDCGEDKQKFRNELFRAWGIGHTDDNDGLLILVCWYGGDQSRRSLEQETGYGLEATLPDVLTSRVVDQEFIPAFQSNRPGDGLIAMVRRYDGILHEKIEISSIEPINQNLAFLLTGIIGFVPGIILAAFYNTTLKARNEQGTSHDTSAFSEENSSAGFSPILYRFALSEIICLIPMLGMAYIGINGFIEIPPSVKTYGVFMFPFLFGWLILLVLLYIAKFFRNDNNDRDDWDSRNDRYDRDDDRDTLNNILDIARDISSFGGGKSGGGGSSKKF